MSEHQAVEKSKREEQRSSQRALASRTASRTNQNKPETQAFESCGRNMSTRYVIGQPIKLKPGLIFVASGPVTRCDGFTIEVNLS